MEAECTNHFLGNKKIPDSWTRNLWTIRTGALNFQGKYQLEDEGSICPLCKKNIQHNMTWHALLECEDDTIQDMYKVWGQGKDTMATAAGYNGARQKGASAETRGKEKTTNEGKNTKGGAMGRMAVGTG